MPQHQQDEQLELSNDVGWCRSCLKRRVLCQFSLCVQCHDTDQPRRGRDDTAGHLCCGWWKTGELLEAWVCPTCNSRHPGTLP